MNVILSFHQRILSVCVSVCMDTFMYISIYIHLFVYVMFYVYECAFVRPKVANGEEC